MLMMRLVLSLRHHLASKLNLEKKTTHIKRPALKAGLFFKI